MGSGSATLVSFNKTHQKHCYDKSMGRHPAFGVIVAKPGASGVSPGSDSIMLRTRRISRRIGTTSRAAKIQRLRLLMGVQGER